MASTSALTDKWVNYKRTKFNRELHQRATEMYLQGAPDDNITHFINQTLEQREAGFSGLSGVLHRLKGGKTGDATRPRTRAEYDIAQRAEDKRELDIVTAREGRAIDREKVINEREKQEDLVKKEASNVEARNVATTSNVRMIARDFNRRQNVKADAKEVEATRVANIKKDQAELDTAFEHAAVYGGGSIKNGAELMGDLVSGRKNLGKESDETATSIMNGVIGLIQEFGIAGPQGEGFAAHKDIMKTLLRRGGYADELARATRPMFDKALSDYYKNRERTEAHSFIIRGQFPEHSALFDKSFDKATVAASGGTNPFTN